MMELGGTIKLHVEAGAHIMGVGARNTHALMNFFVSYLSSGYTIFLNNKVADL